MSAPVRARIALIGDLHGHWDALDERYFGVSDYDLLLFTGDLGSGVRDNGVQVARSIARLAKPAFVMPGNNDAQHFATIASELAHQRGLLELLKASGAAPHQSVRYATGQVNLCGYSLHPLELAGHALTLLAARPFAMGGTELSFAERLQQTHGVGSLADSVARLCQLVDQAPTRDLLVLAHNGPFGLGDDPTDPWGCDFKRERADWGDRDLAEALRYARARGKRVLAVIAGHMHLGTRDGRERVSQRVHDGVLHVNPAQVPRIFNGGDAELRQHFVLELTSDGNGSELQVSARDVTVEA